MKFKLPSFHRPLTLLARRAVVIAICLGVVFDGWLLWQGWEQWSDQPLPPERVTAKQLRVSESQRQQLLQNIATYQKPATVPTLPSITFQGGTGSSTTTTP